MSKKFRKLNLSTETVRALAGAALDAAVGGAECVGSCTPQCPSRRPLGCMESERLFHCTPKSFEAGRCQGGTGVICAAK